jgi:multidrug transporter EmrE-like cation transporter
MKVFLFIFLATIFEAAGDAIIRIALHRHSFPGRVGLFAAGSLLLTLYGTSLNLAPIDFGTATGVYIAMLFVMFQITNYIFFHQAPTTAVLIGGAFIVAGAGIVYAGAR